MSTQPLPETELIMTLLRQVAGGRRQIPLMSGSAARPTADGPAVLHLPASPAAAPVVDASLSVAEYYAAINWAGRAKSVAAAAPAAVSPVRATAPSAAPRAASRVSPALAAQELSVAEFYNAIGWDGADGGLAEAVQRVRPASAA